MQIHVHRDGQNLGPYTAEQVQQHLQTGAIHSQDLAWHEGLDDWQPISALSLGLLQPVSSGAPPPIPPAEPQYHHVAAAKFIVLSVCTMGLYELFWFYKNWKFVRDRDNSGLWPFWRAVFAPLWCYSLGKEIANDSGLSAGRVVAIALFYLGLSMAWRLPDPYWTVSILTFVPLLFLVHGIHAVNKNTGARGRHYARFGFGSIIVCLIGLPLLTLTLLLTFDLVPNTKVASGDEIPSRYLRFLREQGIVDEGETVLHFYSNGFFSIKSDGNILTDRRVISYYDDPETGERIVEGAAFAEIADLEVFYSESDWDDTVIEVILGDEESFSLVLSAEDKKDRAFVEALEKLRNQKP